MPKIGGIERTLRTLLRSGNPSATATLVAGLESSSDELRTGAVRALAMREDAAGHRALIVRLHRLPASVGAALADVPQSAPLAHSLPSMIAGSDGSLAGHAAEAAALWKAIDTLASVVRASRDAGPQLLPKLTGVGAVLVQELQHRLESDDRSQGDPSFARRAAMNELVAVLNDYDRFPVSAWIDALLAITPGDEPAVLNVLVNPSHSAHGPLVERLRTSRRPGVARLLGYALSDTRSPQPLLDIAAERTEPDVLSAMFSPIKTPLGMRRRENCRRIEAFAWLAPDVSTVLLELPDSAQAAAISLAAESKSSRRQLVTAIGLILTGGGPESRVAATKAIEHVPSHLAAEPLAAALECGEPQATAAAAKMLRKKNLPQATGRLLGLLDHADADVRRSAQRSLKELSFATYREHYLALDGEQRRSAGKLVGKADPLAIESLRAELRSGVARRRLHALELIETMSLAPSLAKELIAATEDRDGGVRCEAVRLLGALGPSAEVRQAVRLAAQDRSPAVRDAAAGVAEKLGEPALLVTEEAW